MSDWAFGPKKYTTSSTNFQLFDNRKSMNVKFKFDHFLN